MVFDSVRVAVLLLVSLLVPVGEAAWGQPEKPGTAIRFVEAGASAGIDHVHHKPILDRKLDPIMPVLTGMGAAAAAGDFNNDGKIDLYVTDSQQGKPNRLYRNDGDGKFTEVGSQTKAALLNDAENGISTDCVWGDVDNDGWADLYVVRWGRDVLLRNNGDGTFRDVTNERFRRRDGSPGTDWKNGNAVILLDYDLDGRLDIYVGNYFADFDLMKLDTTVMMNDSFDNSRNAGRNQLFHQEADGSFRDVAPALGVDDAGWTLAAGSADVDNDGWPDLYVANDFGTDKLFVNQRNGTFKDVSLEALGIDTKKGMNVDFGDFNADGWLDIYVTNITTKDFLNEGNMLWLNEGVREGHVDFTDVSTEAGVSVGGWGWGARFFDPDNDGDLDLFSANGFISAGTEAYAPDLVTWFMKQPRFADALSWPAIGQKSFSGFERKRFWRNVDRSTFVEEAAAVGLDSDRDGRGVVIFDYDNDGDQDIYMANQGQAGQLFRNETVRGGHWLELTLRGNPATRANRDAVGARITVELDGGVKLIRERDGGNGFSAQNDPRPHLGLGAATKIRRLEVRWPDGGVQEWKDVAVDQHLVVQQDPAKYAGAGASPVTP